MSNYPSAPFTVNCSKCGEPLEVNDRTGFGEPGIVWLSSKGSHYISHSDCLPPICEEAKSDLWIIKYIIDSEHLNPVSLPDGVLSL